MAGDECYEEHMQTLAQSTKPAGYGGTDVRCVPEYITEHGIKPRLVVLTDGDLLPVGSCPVPCSGASWTTRAPSPPWDKPFTLRARHCDVKLNPIDVVKLRLT